MLTFCSRRLVLEMLVGWSDSEQHLRQERRPSRRGQPREEFEVLSDGEAFVVAFGVPSGTLALEQAAT